MRKPSTPLLILTMCVCAPFGPILHAESPAYRTIVPTNGDPFELRPEFEPVEPVLAGTDQPLPGWLGNGHIIHRDGKLLLLYDHQNQVLLSHSSDMGKTWTQPTTVPTAQPEGIRIHRPAIVTTKDGDLWVFFYALLRFDAQNPDNSVNNLWAIRSRDGGRTWDPAQCIYEGYVGMLQGAIQTSQGNIVIPLCDYRAIRRFVSLCVVSADSGKTWRPTEPIDIGYPETSFPLSPNLNGGALEPSIAETPDGRLLMMIRTVIGEFYQSESSDGGLTWTKPIPLPLSCGGPCNLVSLPGGGLATAYNPANLDSPLTKRWGSPIGYDSQSLAGLAPAAKSWHVTEAFVRQIPGKTRVVHSTLTGLPDGQMLITLPERSTLLRCSTAFVLGEKPAPTGHLTPCDDLAPLTAQNPSHSQAAVSP